MATHQKGAETPGQIDVKVFDTSRKKKKSRGLKHGASPASHAKLIHQPRSLGDALEGAGDGGENNMGGEDGPGQRQENNDPPGSGDETDDGPVVITSQEKRLCIIAAQQQELPKAPKLYHDTPEDLFKFQEAWRVYSLAVQDAQARGVNVVTQRVVDTLTPNCRRYIAIYGLGYKDPGQANAQEFEDYILQKGLYAEAEPELENFDAATRRLAYNLKTTNPYKRVQEYVTKWDEAMRKYRPVMREKDRIKKMVYGVKPDYLRKLVQREMQMGDEASQKARKNLIQFVALLRFHTV